MPIYHALGSLPPKKHITFEKEDGSLYREELFSTLGFAGIYSTLYHIHLPTEVREVGKLDHVALAPWQDAPRQCFHFRTAALDHGGDLVTARKAFLYNDSTILYAATFSDNDPRFYRNGRHDEVLFTHHGRGELHSEYGVLPFGPGDYLVIPRGVMYRFEKLSADNRFFIIESKGPVQTPKRYRNHFGQLLEDAPFSERDIRRPSWMEPIDSREPVELVVKSGHEFYVYALGHHPFDVVGWDGYFYPWAFNIKDFQPIVGQIHLPPPIHQVFETPGAVICNFVPRLFDFHPKAVPAPYFHQNVDSDEVLYYAEGDFMSRKGIEEGSITLHPGDVPHGPQPGKTEASVGEKDCYEYAVMVDTFAPLLPTLHVRDTMDPGYLRSWL